jgi:hypothetical protein
VIPEAPWWVTVILAVPTLILGTGRLSRAIYHDAFPPSIWFRIQWDKLTEGSDWNLLMHCPWCITHWLVLGSMGAFALGFIWPWVWVVWWLWHTWFALSYLTSMVIVRDEPEE